jgi:alpha-L-fucosidase 2
MNSILSLWYSEPARHLLDALPVGNGSVQGLRARGGFAMSLTWQSGKLKHATILLTCGNDCDIALDHIGPVTADGQPVPTECEDGFFRFATTAGKMYDLHNA